MLKIEKLRSCQRTRGLRRDTIMVGLKERDENKREKETDK